MKPIDCYNQYRAGWTDGAKASAMNPARAKHKNKHFAQIYVDAYNDGYRARCKMSELASERFDYTPSPLR